MDWIRITVEEIAKLLETNLTKGLSKKEAKNRLLKLGENVISDNSKKDNLLVKFLKQLNDFMVIVLIIAAAVSFGVSYFEGNGEYLDSLIIIFIVVVNAILGMIQEAKAEKAIAALKDLSAPKARVIRDGEIIEIPSSEVVVGDILKFKAGDIVCADCKIIESKNIMADEAALTGESEPVLKDENYTPNDLGEISVGDRKNMLFSSSYITYGNGTCICIKTGMDTEVGKIANLLICEDDNKTPLQIRLAKTGQSLGTIAMIICFLIFVMGVLKNNPPFLMFMTAISLAVAAIPEGLPAIVTIVLAIGIKRLSNKNAIIRKLPAVETLGSATVICSDKTGTLTQNKMTVTKIANANNIIPILDKKSKDILSFSTLCNDSYFSNGDYFGEPTEKALVKAFEDLGETKSDLEKNAPRIAEIPFSSERKLMTTIHKDDKEYIIITKGAPDILINLCDCYLEDGQVHKMNSKTKNSIINLNMQMAEDALRVIGVAYKNSTNKPENITPTNLEKNLIFVGLVGMIDPPRPEVFEAVKICKEAHIKPVMITGDHLITARAIASQLGIFNAGDKIITGEELSKKTFEEICENIEEYSVFARVSPENKVQIVKAYKKNGNVVAMTGDGVNDAPALKAADIGCAMGKSGTDVSKGASDMILVDDNFATIVEAVKEGRGVYSNIKKAVHFLLSSNIGEIITIFFAMLFNWGSPLSPIQLLWVNLVTDSLPAIALGMDTYDQSIMEEHPKKVNESLFSNGLGKTIFLQGIMIGMLALIAFSIGKKYFDLTVASTMAFAVLSISQLFHAFNMRSPQSIFKKSFFSNKYLIWAFIAGMILQISVISVPSLATIFLVTPLTIFQWSIVMLLSFIPIVVVEFEKNIA